MSKLQWSSDATATPWNFFQDEQRFLMAPACSVHCICSLCYRHRIQWTKMMIRHWYSSWFEPNIELKWELEHSLHCVFESFSIRLGRKSSEKPTLDLHCAWVWAHKQGIHWVLTWFRWYVNKHIRLSIRLASSLRSWRCPISDMSEVLCKCAFCLIAAVLSPYLEAKRDIVRQVRMLWLRVVVPRLTLQPIKVLWSCIDSSEKRG